MKYSLKLILSAAVLVGTATLGSAPAFAQQCRDPWITQAIREVTGRAPQGSGESGECTYTQYGGGRWGSYAELKGYVQARLGRSLPTIPPDFLTGGSHQAAPGQVRVPQSQAAQMRSLNGRQQFLFQGKWYNLIGMDGATLIGMDGGT
jgi:hypothetical protein